jgi:hypothetical protein
MATNNDLTAPQNTAETTNPQATGSGLGASDATQFQSSADAGLLNETREIQVVSTGPAIQSSRAQSDTSGTTIVIVIIISLALALLAASILRFIMKQPAPEEVTVPPPEPVQKPAKAAARGKKKPPRSKRRK